MFGVGILPPSALATVAPKKIVHSDSINFFLSSSMVFMWSISVFYSYIRYYSFFYDIGDLYDIKIKHFSENDVEYLT